MTSPVRPDPSTPLSAEFTRAVTDAIGAFLDRQSGILSEMGAETGPLLRIARDLAAGGKRLRPAFCYWGFVAAAGRPDDQLNAALVRAAASLDLLHISALVHDDVMDASDLRRGRPAAHRQFEQLHSDLGWLGDPSAFGRSGAILLGDLLLIWSMQMLHESGIGMDVLDRGLPVMEVMRTEVTAGQFLDVVSQAQDRFSYRADDGDDQKLLAKSLDEASRVVEYKSARYTVRRPLQFGAALGAADDQLQAALGAFGSPIGRAFQYRDDLLGVFGDSRLTGKPTGDDLREGKRTVLVAQALAGADPSGRKLLEAQIGNPDLDAAGVTELQQVIISSGARDAVEQMIDHDHDRALEALAAAKITEDGRVALTALASAAVRREF